MRQPTNQVLLEKINNLHEKVDDIKAELKGVRESNDKNTEFRNKATGIVALIGTICGFIGGLILWGLNKVWK